MRNMRVVFSMDLTTTFVLGVKGACASLKGLKLRTAFTIRVDVEGLARTRTDRVLRVASTTRASLGFVQLVACLVMDMESIGTLTCYFPATRRAFYPTIQTLRLLGSGFVVLDDWEAPWRGKCQADRRATRMISNHSERT